MTLLIIYLTLAIAVSFICSIVEAVILSVSKTFVEIKAKEGKSSALLLQKLKVNINRPLSAILTVNTIAHTIGAAGVGAQAVAVFGEVYFGLISAILTFLILFFSEIIPKTIGAVYWKRLALPSALIIRGMIFLSYPLVIVSEFVAKLISKNKDEFSTSREEVVAIAQLGSKEGVLEESESKIITSLIKAKNVTLEEIMTPRTVLIAYNETTRFHQFIEKKSDLKYSRIPVFTNNIDNITGYILNSDVLIQLSENQSESTLQSLKRPITIFNEKTKIPKAFEKLVVNKEHIALITNEYGGTEGIVTMEDIVETLLGFEIVDEKDKVADLQKLAKRRWEKKQKKLDSQN